MGGDRRQMLADAKALNDEVLEARVAMAVTANRLTRLNRCVDACAVPAPQESRRVRRKGPTS